MRGQKKKKRVKRKTEEEEERRGERLAPDLISTLSLGEVEQHVRI